MPSLVWDAARGLPRGLRAFGLGVLLILVGLGLVVTVGHEPVGAQASDTVCSQSALQAALSAGQSTITFAPGCTIKLTSSLTIGPGVTTTINGTPWS